MSVLTIPNIFINNVSPVDATTTNANNTAVAAAVNSIDKTNIGAVGLVASNLKPTTAAEATFGGLLAYTFPAGVITNTFAITNVKDTRYGAKGDGVTDDTAAIRAAVIAGAGGVVYFPPGTYIVNGQVDAPSTAKRGIPISQNTMLFAHKGTVTITQGAAANVSGLFCTSNYYPNTTSGGAEFANITIDGFTFNFNGSAQTIAVNKDQYAVVMLGSLMTCVNCRFINGGVPGLGAAQIGTGLLIGSAIEEPVNGARAQANHNRFENCQGVAMWMTNLKGETYGGPGSGSIHPDAGIPPPGSYGSIGGSDFSHNEFFSCNHGIYIEDRCNGWIADGIVYRAPLSTLATNGNGVSILNSSNGKFSAVVQGAVVGINMTGYPQTPVNNIVFDAVVDTTYNGAVQIDGQIPVAGTTNAAINPGDATFAVTLTQGTLPDSGTPGSVWMAIIDGASSEFIRVLYTHTGTVHVATDTPIQHAHAMNRPISVDTGMKNIAGTVVVSNAGQSGGSPNTGVGFSAARDCALLVRSYDSRQIPFAPGTYPSVPTPTNYYGVLFASYSQRCVVYGNLSSARDFGMQDDGTNAECQIVGIVGQDDKAGNHNKIYATILSADGNIPSHFHGVGAPNPQVTAKAGDRYHRADGTLGTISPNTTEYYYDGANWRARISAVGRPTFNGTGAQVTFAAPHGLGSSPTHANVTLYGTPIAAYASGWSYNWDATNISITFLTPPAAGVNNVAFEFEAWI